jgi:SAM-dependent methyltransferase
LTPLSRYYGRELSRLRLWNERYARGDMADKPAEPVMITAVDNLAPGRALDVACGRGRNSLYLAVRGWQVTAVDYSEVALSKLRERAAEAGVKVDALHADLEKGEFTIGPDAYDLIVDCCYLQRSLFAAMRAGVRPEGLVVCVIPLTDPHSTLAMNPEFLLDPGELRRYFDGWEILHYSEGRPENDPSRRLRAQIVARRPAAGR